MSVRSAVDNILRTLTASRIDIGSGGVLSRCAAPEPPELAAIFTRLLRSKRLHPYFARDIPSETTTGLPVPPRLRMRCEQGRGEPLIRERENFIFSAECARKGAERRLDARSKIAPELRIEFKMMDSNLDLLPNCDPCQFLLV